MHTPGHSTINEMADVLQAVIAEHTGVYVSAPITSGRRLFAMQKDLPKTGAARAVLDPELIEQHIIAPNVADARTLVKSLREHFGYTVIDPTILVVRDWTQDHYAALWGNIVRRYARLVAFSDGWQYSSGCTYEFVVAHDSGIETVDASLNPLSREHGAALIAGAQEELNSSGARAIFYDVRLAQLRGAPLHTSCLLELGRTEVERSMLCVLMIGCVTPARMAAFLCSRNGEQHGEIVSALRERAKVVIDSSAFTPTDWSSAALDDLWTKAIEAYAAEVVLGSSYAYQEHCVAALCQAAKLGLDVRGTDGRDIPFSQAVESVETAVGDLDSRGIDSSHLRELLATLIEVLHVA